MFIPNLDTKISLTRQLAQDPNICDRFSEEDLSKIGSAVWDGYDLDLQSRSNWRRRMDNAMDLAMQVQEVKSFPWPGAANVVFPLVTIAALQFSAKAYPALIQGNNVWAYRNIGVETAESRERALACADALAIRGQVPGLGFAHLAGLGSARVKLHRLGVCAEILQPPLRRHHLVLLRNPHRPGVGRVALQLVAHAVGDQEIAEQSRLPLVR